ncbi:hypothetical protein Tco_0505479, partial [Tanacetum coccineum]
MGSKNKIFQNFLKLIWIRHIGHPGYGVSDLLGMAYWATPVRRIGSLGTVFCTSWYIVLAESVLFLISDQSIIYDVYTDVDTAYSSKSGNGLLIRQSLGDVQRTKPIGYGVLRSSGMAYWALGYGVSALLVRCFVHLGNIYGVSVDVDTAYSSKSGNGLEFFKVFRYGFRQLKLVLRVEKKINVIKQPIPPAPVGNSVANVLAEWNAIYDAYNEVACLMLGSMTPELHRPFENYSPYEMLQELKCMFEKQAGVERFDLIQTFHACKQEEGKPVADYVLKMKGYLDQLERLGYVLPQDLSVGLILNGPTSDFARFVRNYNMHNIGKTIGKLHAMIIEYAKGLPKKAETPQVIMIKGGKIQKANKKSLKAKGKGKANGKGKDKQVYIPKPKNPKPTAKEHPAKDDTCHHCKEGFREARKLKQGALYLYVGNGVRAQVEAIGS